MSWKTLPENTDSDLAISTESPWDGEQLEDELNSHVSKQDTLQYHCSYISNDFPWRINSFFWFSCLGNTRINRYLIRLISLLLSSRFSSCTEKIRNHFISDKTDNKFIKKGHRNDSLKLNKIWKYLATVIPNIVIFWLEIMSDGLNVCQITRSDMSKGFRPQQWKHGIYPMVFPIVI